MIMTFFPRGVITDSFFGGPYHFLATLTIKNPGKVFQAPMIVGSGGGYSRQVLKQTRSQSGMPRTLVVHKTGRLYEAI